MFFKNLYKNTKKNVFLHLCSTILLSVKLGFIQKTLEFAGLV